MTVAYMLMLALGIGFATAAQSPTNGSLGTIVGPIQASLVSMFGGLIILAALCPFLGKGDFALLVNVEFWQMTGGVYAAYIVLVMATCTRYLGVALALTLLMLGQLLGGLAIDTLGLMGAEVVEISPLRLAGCALVFLGIVAVYADRLRSEREENPDEDANENDGKANARPISGRLILFTALTFSAGAASAVQAPVNSGLGAAIGTLEASIVSFAGGAIIAFILTLIVGRGKLQSFKGTKPWQFTGGIYGAFGVPALTVSTPVLGVGLVMGGSMVGQLIGGMIVDQFGLFRVQKRRVNVLRITGALVLLIGVVFVTVARMI